jgi:uncharacterized membrane protein (UPF0127 family)
MLGSKSHLVLGLVLVLAGMSRARAEEPLERLEVDTASGPHVLQVEVMRTEAQRERGLMDRKSLARDRGMLFDFQVDQPVRFWMKDTYIPLDMVFIDHTGKVVSIFANATPLSETPIPSGGPVSGVLEINGGEAADLGIVPGDIVRQEIFKH